MIKGSEHLHKEMKNLKLTYLQYNAKVHEHLYNNRQVDIPFLSQLILPFSINKLLFLLNSSNTLGNDHLI